LPEFSLEFSPGVEVQTARGVKQSTSREEGKEICEKISIALRDEFQRRRKPGGSWNRPISDTCEEPGPWIPGGKSIQVNY
jgi:hypothetical protein